MVFIHLIAEKFRCTFTQLSQITPIISILLWNKSRQSFSQMRNSIPRQIYLYIRNLIAHGIKFISGHDESQLKARANIKKLQSEMKVLGGASTKSRNQFSKTFSVCSPFSRRLHLERLKRQKNPTPDVSARIRFNSNAL